MASIFLNSNDLRQPIQMKLFKKQKVFVNVFLRFWNVDQILNILKKKKMTLITYVCLKRGTAKDMVR